MKACLQKSFGCLKKVTKNLENKKEMYQNNIRKSQHPINRKNNQNQSMLIGRKKRQEQGTKKDEKDRIGSELLISKREMGVDIEIEREREREGERGGKEEDINREKERNRTK